MSNFIGIVTLSKNNGIGNLNSLPWKLNEDILFLKTITKNNIVVMGKKTYDDTIPIEYKLLKDRLNIVLTHNPDLYDNNEHLIYTDYTKIYTILKEHSLSYCNVFIIGGSSIYEMFFYQINTLYITYIDKYYETDQYFPKITYDFKLTVNSRNHWSNSEECFYRFMKYERSSTYNSYTFDIIYKNLMSKIIDSNDIRQNRTGIDTLSIFGEQLSFNIDKYVPLLTTKRVAWKSCIEELLWFMRGDTDANILKQKKVHIWDGNSSREFLDNVGLNHLKEGDCGANYSFQWRYFGQEYVNCETKYEKNTSFDQIENIIHLLKTDPFSRRIFLSAWNPMDLDKTVLPPCHVSVQFYVDNNRGLSCHMYQRSCDVFLGLPFNIFSYTVLTYILAKKCDMTPKKLIISLGDTHIYTNHIEQVKEQLQRSILTYPILNISDNVKDKTIEDININDFELIGYFPHNSIKAPMAV